MKAYVNGHIHVPDDFKAGECTKCPVHKEEDKEKEDRKENAKSCGLGYKSNSCLLDLRQP